MTLRESRTIREVNEDLGRLASFFTSEELDGLMVRCGMVLRRRCVEAVNAAVYDTPRSTAYIRTGFLRATIYVATKRFNDYSERRAEGKWLVGAVLQGADEEGWDNFGMSEHDYHVANFLPVNREGQVNVVAAAMYAFDVEFGNNPRGPRPFMRPGGDSAAGEVEQILTEGLRQFNSRKASLQPRDAAGRFTRRP
jgi:hypothetical protein